MSTRTAQRWILLGTGLAVTLCAEAAWAADSGSDDRLAFSANGSRLSGDHGGGGGSLAWIHNFTPATLADAEVEYEQLANAHWMFGSLIASTGFGSAGHKLNLYAEGHEGAGDIGQHPFKYSVVAAGAVQSLGTHFSLQLEDRQFDIGGAHGNLPKLGASLAWGPQVLTTVAYAYSVRGNLGTRLLSVRIDKYSAGVSWLAGGAFGPASPAVLNLETGNVQPGKRLKEGFVGLSKPLSRGKVTLVADYQDLAGTRRATLSLSYVVNLRASGQPR
jgi:hypothetical protein